MVSLAQQTFVWVEQIYDCASLRYLQSFKLGF